MDSPRVKILQEKYKQSLPEKLDELQKLIHEHRQQRSEIPVANDPLYNFLHRLAGSSGMYGYEPISAAARNVMRDLESDQPDGIDENVDKLHHLLVTVAWS